MAAELQSTASAEHDGKLGRLYVDKGDRNGGLAAQPSPTARTLQ